MDVKGHLLCLMRVLVTGDRVWLEMPDEHNLLHETGLLGLYRSPSKGCYVGQEVVARLDGRGGHVNKALCRLRLRARPGRRDGAARGKGCGPLPPSRVALAPSPWPTSIALPSNRDSG